MPTIWDALRLLLLLLLQVRMPEGDTVVLDDSEPLSSDKSGGQQQQYGEVVDAEFKDLK
jgi:hypothetical protein